jgi:RimJ/RimL family protein N-acetyltransferase
MRDGETGGYAYASLIVTRRLLLRPPDSRDQAAIAALAANRRIAENLAAAPGEGAGAHCATFAIVERATNAVIGATARGPGAGSPGSVEIASWVGEPYWGRGCATEASQALIDSIFADPRVTSVGCSNRASNHRARRVIEKCGFQFTGTGMVRSPALRGAVPIERFILERRNWKSLKDWGADGRTMEAGDAPRDNAA